MSRKDELPLYKKFLICLLVVMTVFMSVCIGTSPAYATTVNPLIVVPQLQQTDNVIIQQLSAEEERLTSEGFTITSVKLDVDKMVEECSYMNHKATPHYIVKVAATHIYTDTENYYFKSEADAQELVNKLQENSIAFVQEQSEVDINDLTIDEVIQNKLNELDEHKRQVEEQKERERITREQVSSRSGNFRRTTETSSFPLVGFRYISSSYGARHGKMHTGVDLAADSGTHILAWKSGTVITAKWSGNYGNFIEIQHADGTISRYAHLSGYAVAAGNVVNQGQTIGYVGSTGNSTRSSSPLRNKN